jgi:ubiquinone/menaquinone biosynthesis C-methylase UbiE
MKNEENLAKKWNRIYKKGNPWGNKPSSEAKEIARYLNKGDRVLDLGCGVGRDAIFLAKMGCEIWGIDISSEAIRKAESYSDSNQIHFSVGDVENLRFKDGYFDVVFSLNVLHMTDIDVQKSANEIFRVLRKNGIVYICLNLNKKHTNLNRKILKFVDVLLNLNIIELRTINRIFENILAKSILNKKTKKYHKRGHIIQCFRNFKLIRIKEAKKVSFREGPRIVDELKILLQK